MMSFWMWNGDLTPFTYDVLFLFHVYNFVAGLLAILSDTSLGIESLEPCRGLALSVRSLRSCAENGTIF